MGITDPDADIDGELDEMAAAISEEPGGAIREMLRKPYLRATIFVLGLGFHPDHRHHATVTYGPKIFGAMGIESDQQKLLLNVGIQFIALVAVLVSMRTVDRWGRRPILLTGISIMIFAQLLMVITFATVHNDQYAGWQVALGFCRDRPDQHRVRLRVRRIGLGVPPRLPRRGCEPMARARCQQQTWWPTGSSPTSSSAMEKVGGAASFGFFAVMALLAWDLRVEARP